MLKISLKQYVRVALCGGRREIGTNHLGLELEHFTTRYLGIEDFIVFGMGFTTNSLNLPLLISLGCLKKHASVILGL